MNVKWSRPERQPTHFHSTIYSPSISTALSLLMPPLLSIPGFKTTSVKVLIHVKLKPYQQHTQCANSNVASPINTSNTHRHTQCTNSIALSPTNTTNMHTQPQCTNSKVLSPINITNTRGHCKHSTISKPQMKKLNFGGGNSESLKNSHSHKSSPNWRNHTSLPC